MAEKDFRKKITRNLNKIILVGLLFAIYLWSSIYRNTEANPSGFEVQVSFLDVGQGDATLLNFPGSKQVLIDGARGGFVTEEIKKRMPANDRNIEYVVATHPDADHIGGFASVADSFTIGRFIRTKATSSSATFTSLEEKLKGKNIKIDYAAKGDHLTFAPSATGELLWPPENIEGLSSNDSSIVLKIDYKNACALFTGDVELEAQNQILAAYPKDYLKCELYKIPHHGSGGALNMGFLEAVSPKYATISAGKNNSYGHPAQTVLDALGKIAALISRSDELGTIDFVTSGGSWTKR